MMTIKYKMKVILTENNLKVGKWECNSVTIQKYEDYFSFVMHDIKGYTKHSIKIDTWGRKYPKTLKLQKRLKSKTFDYEGIELKKGSSHIENQGYYHSINSKKQFVNYYFFKKENKEV